jgi:selenide, water dikinase
MEHAEDAGVYRLRDDLAIIQTVDFFTPIVDDPHTFGRIAVTNALSDIYAMGGRPITAMNIVCFPIRTMDVKILREILRGGLDQMREAGVLLIGGHSVEDNEPKYGLSVTGVIHPERILFNNGARPGDRLILTKPLGTGIVSTALKAGVADAALVARSVAAMTTLNRRAAELMAEMVDVHACTDVTGFGFLGHALEMAEGSGVGMRIDASSVPFFPEIRRFVEEEMIPGGLIRNRQFREKQIDVGPGCPNWLIDILFDPQTAGGLLIALPPDSAKSLLNGMRATGIDEAAIVGEVTASPKGIIRVE